MPLGLRHCPSGRNSRFHGAGLSFADYLAATHSMVREVRQRAGLPHDAGTVAGNAPFELIPDTSGSRRGVLFTHGLSDGPYHLRPLAACFRRNGFLVRALLLPGHGTQPGDLLEVRWQDWAEAVAWGARQLAGEVDELYLAGYSAGAALSILQAAQDRRVRGLFLFAPALQIPARARWARLHKLYGWLRPAAAWLTVLPDRDPYKYESFPKNAAAEMYALTQALPQAAFDIPVFAVASADDATVEAAATWDFMRRVRHPQRKLIWYAGTSCGTGLEEHVEVVNCFLPELRILSSAHTAIVLPPSDAHYGEHGAYANCLHYAQDAEKAARCQTQPEWLGEVLPQYLQRGVLRRLTYNPHYAAMEASLQHFISALDQ